MARVIFSPTTQPMLPPMKRGSMAQIWTGRPSSRPVRGDHGVAQLGGLLHALQALAVRLAVHEIQRVGGAQLGVEALVLAVVQQQLQARDGIDADVRAALGADVPVGSPGPSSR